LKVSSRDDAWHFNEKSGQWYQPNKKKRKKAQPMLEKELPMPDLWVGIHTGNVGVKIGTNFIYIQVVSDVPDNTGRVRYYPVPGARRVFKDCPGLRPYFGKLDDEMVVNLMMYGTGE
jgi:hypothetical protein